MRQEMGKRLFFDRALQDQRHLGRGYRDGSSVDKLRQRELLQWADKC